MGARTIGVGVGGNDGAEVGGAFDMRLAVTEGIGPGFSALIGWACFSGFATVFVMGYFSCFVVDGADSACLSAPT